MNRLLSSKEVCGRLGLTYRQLDHWCSMGYLGGDVHHPGSGRIRRFTEEEVQRAEEIKRHLDALRDLGVTPPGGPGSGQNPRSVI